MSPPARSIVSISAVLLAGGFEVHKSLPPGMQLDWEAFVAPNARVFTDTVSQYLTLTPSDIDQVLLAEIADTFISQRNMQVALLSVD